MKREAVECCPHCMSENTYPDKDVEVEGFVEHCTECGAEIFLCDECTQAQIAERESAGIYPYQSNKCTGGKKTVSVNVGECRDD